MKRTHLSECALRILQLLLCISLPVGLFTARSLGGSPTHALAVEQLTASTSSCPSISAHFRLPTHFDLLHVSSQELHRYFLPSRPPPNDLRAVSDWLKMVKSTKKIVCTTNAPSVLDHGRPVSSRPLVDCVSEAPSGTSCSTNWAGYTVRTGPGFDDAYGEWDIPCIDSTNSPSDSMEGSWVGLGGADETNLWQVGSAWKSSLGYYLWYQAVGDNGTVSEKEIATTSCGDTIWAEVQFTPNDPSNNVSFSIHDNGTVYTGQAPSGFSSGSLSAEWIDERPNCSAHDFYKLADYSHSQWRNAFAAPNNANASASPLGTFDYTQEWMGDYGGTRIAVANALGSNAGSGTDNFTTDWEGNGTSHCG